MGDGTFLYLDCGLGYVCICLSKFIEFYTKNKCFYYINDTLIKLIFKKRHFGDEDVNSMWGKKTLNLLDT